MSDRKAAERMLEAREKRSRLRLRVAIVPLAPRGAVWGGGERGSLAPASWIQVQGGAEDQMSQLLPTVPRGFPPRRTHPSSRRAAVGDTQR